MNTISTLIRQGAKKLHTLHGRLAKSKAARSGLNIGLVVIMGLIILCFAQVATQTKLMEPAKDKSRYSRVFPYSHKQEFTTTREITISPTRDEGTTTYPAGTKIRILFSYEENFKTGDPKANIARRINGGPSSRLHMHRILIGDTNEQIVIPTEAIAELGGTPGDPLTKQSTQPPKYRNIVNELPEEYKDFIWTGAPTGDENVPSSDPDGEQLLFQKLNALRASKGRPKVKWNEDLARGARYQAGDMYSNDYVGEHMIFDSIIPPNATNKRMARHNFVEPEAVALKRFYPNALGANLAKTEYGRASNPEAVAQGHGPAMWGAWEKWVDSPGHYKAMLRNYSTVGIGNVGDAWVMAFGE